MDAHPTAAALLRATHKLEVVEDSPHDAVWGVGQPHPHSDEDLQRDQPCF